MVIAHHGKVIALKGLGHFTYGRCSKPVKRTTIYDLASVSKVVATTTACMIMHDRGQFHLEHMVADTLPEFADSDARKRQITFRMLLAHSSGLPAYVKLFQTAHTKDELLQQAFQVPLTADPGTHAEYSDIGFILLGEIVPPTENDQSFRHRIIQNEVNDENAWVMGGVAGHAGVFSTARDVSIFAQCMLRGGNPLVRPATVEIFTRREDFPPGTSRALGWDTPSLPSQSGKHFSAKSYGHLGYTGTSLWIDPERQLSVTLLTNRTWPDRSSQGIKQIRPAFHDAVVEALA